MQASNSWASISAMDLLQYISDTERRRQLAEDVGTSPDYLWQMATSWRGKRPSRLMAKAIESATKGEVTAVSLRPDLFEQAA